MNEHEPITCGWCRNDFDSMEEAIAHDCNDLPQLGDGE